MQGVLSGSMRAEKAGQGEARALATDSTTQPFDPAEGKPQGGKRRDRSAGGTPEDHERILVMKERALTDKSAGCDSAPDTYRARRPHAAGEASMIGASARLSFGIGRTTSEVPGSIHVDEGCRGWGNSSATIWC
jgi:hypothetical protein